jgi:hypothetical protein
LATNLKQRKVFVILSLLGEIDDLTNEALEQEIQEGLSGTCIPWCKKVEQVRVIEE